MSTTAQQLDLSVLALEAADLLKRIDEKHGKALQTDYRVQGEALVRMRGDDGQKATDAATKAATSMIDAACADVLEDWEDHSQASFLQDRFADVRRKLAPVGHAALLTFWGCLRRPEDYCRCGRLLRTNQDHARKRCPGCFTVEYVDEGMTR